MIPSQLKGHTFKLGRAVYVVAESQPYRDKVRCYRENDNVVSVVRLPLVFVLERLAEEVSLEDLPA